MTRKEEIREAGYYWIKEPGGYWTVAHLVGRAFCLNGYSLPESDLEEVGKRIYPPDELTAPESSPAKEVGAVIYSFGYEANQSSPAPLESQEVSQRVAKLIIEVRDAIALGDHDLAYHFLYQIASPDFDKTDPWKETEEIARGRTEGDLKVSPDLDKFHDLERNDGSFEVDAGDNGIRYKPEPPTT